MTQGVEDRPKLLWAMLFLTALALSTPLIAVQSSGTHISGGHLFWLIALGEVGGGLAACLLPSKQRPGPLRTQSRSKPAGRLVPTGAVIAANAAFVVRLLGGAWLVSVVSFLSGFLLVVVFRAGRVLVVQRREHKRAPD